VFDWCSPSGYERIADNYEFKVIQNQIAYMHAYRLPVLVLVENLPAGKVDLFTEKINPHFKATGSTYVLYEGAGIYEIHTNNQNYESFTGCFRNTFKGVSPARRSPGKTLKDYCSQCLGLIKEKSAALVIESRSIFIHRKCSDNFLKNYEDVYERVQILEDVVAAFKN
jgi:hypothetical protein